jgi:hypothetical protein
VLFSVVVLLVSGVVLLVVLVVVESVDFCVTSGDAASAGDALVPGAGLVCSVVVVVVVSFVVPWHPTIIVPAMRANAPTATNEAIFFEVFIEGTYQT